MESDVEATHDVVDSGLATDVYLVVIQNAQDGVQSVCVGTDVSVAINVSASDVGRTTRINRVQSIPLHAGVSVSSDTVTYPHPRKVRGRPKGTGKSLNRVYDKSKKKHIQEHCAKPVAVATDNCVKCGLAEPPVRGRKRRNEHVQGVQCDKCDYWYHVQCTLIETVAVNNEPFLCVRCV